MMVLGHKVYCMGVALENTKWSMVERKPSLSSKQPVISTASSKENTGTWETIMYALTEVWGAGCLLAPTDLEKSLSKR